MRLFRPLFCLVLLAFTSMALAATEVIPLNYRTAEDLLPTVQSVLGNQGKASAYGNQLIVNAPPAKLDELKTLLNQLDTRPRRLLISVDTRDENFQNDSGFSVDGSVGGSSGRVQIGDGGPGNQVRIIRHSTNDQGGGLQQIQATEGYPAQIQVGQSIPLTSTHRDAYGQVYQDTQYRDVTRGLYVVASVTGDIVHVALSSNRDRLAPGSSNVIDLQNTDTRVSGRLGEWIMVGGTNENNASSGTGIVRRYSTQSGGNSTLRLKVEALD